MEESKGVGGCFREYFDVCLRLKLTTVAGVCTLKLGMTLPPLKISATSLNSNNPVSGSHKQLSSIVLKSGHRLSNKKKRSWRNPSPKNVKIISKIAAWNSSIVNAK